MALSTVITKKEVTCSGEGLYHIVLNMKYQDGATILIDQDFSEVWKTGQAYAIVFFNMKEKMKLAIRRYKENLAIFNAAALDTIVTNLNSTVGV